jgi:hypothetical protein
MGNKLLLTVILAACSSSSAGKGVADAHPDTPPVLDASTSLDVVSESPPLGNSDGSSAQCDGSPCQPVVLATGSGPLVAGGLAVDATSVYWVDSKGGRVLACKKTGCGLSPTVLASGQGGPSGIAVANGVAYWTNSDSGTVSFCSVNGCGGTPTVLVSGLSSPGGIAALHSSVYFIEAGDSGSISSCPSSGCVSPTVIASVSGVLVAVDAVNVYWTDGTEVSSCPLAGCSGSPTVLFSAKGATGIALDAANVYVTTDLSGIDSAAGSVLSCSQSGCSGKPSTLATGQGGPMAIAVFGGTVYWGNTQGDGDIWSCAATGCAESPKVVTMAALPLSLAVDSTNVYWASLGDVLSSPL